MLLIWFEPRLCMSQAGLELAKELRVTLTFWSSYIYFLNARVTGVLHHTCIYSMQEAWTQGFVQDDPQALNQPSYTSSSTVDIFGAHGSKPEASRLVQTRASTSHLGGLVSLKMNRSVEGPVCPSLL